MQSNMKDLLVRERTIPQVLGLTIEQATMRLQSAGAFVSVVRCESRKGVPTYDQTRVMRQNILSLDPLKVSLIVSRFQTIIIEER